jgi:hypothetical protein
MKIKVLYNNLKIAYLLFYNKMTNSKMVSLNITKSKNQTKVWRQSQTWYKNGKSNECELFQRNIVENITNLKCSKSNIRLNTDTLAFEDKKYPMKDIDGFDWTEDFDGYQEINNLKLYMNLKMICDKGGSQTRTLREVYHFVKTQLEYLLLHPEIKDTYFMNILDGDESFRNMDKFKYLLSKEKYALVKDYIFVGNMEEFSFKFNSLTNK